MTKCTWAFELVSNYTFNALALVIHLFICMKVKYPTYLHFKHCFVCTQVYIQYMKFARRTAGIKSARNVFKRAREDAQIRHHVGYINWHAARYSVEHCYIQLAVVLE